MDPNHLSHFDKIFSSMKESKKMKPHNFKKSLYRPDMHVDKKKKMQFTQNWKVKNKNEKKQGLSYDYII